jgi:TP901 family phage tail tape measure protein
MDQAFLSLLMGIDETKSTELMRQQLVRVIEKLTAPDFKITFDAEQLRVLENSLDGINGDAIQVLESLKGLQTLKLQDVGLDKIHANLEEIRLTAASIFPEQDVTVERWSKNTQGDLNEVILLMKDGEVGFKKMTASIGELGEVKFGDLKVFPNFEKEIKSKLGTLKTLEKEVLALEKKSGKGVITDTEVYQKDSKEAEQLQKVVEIQKLIGQARKEGIISQQRQIELTQQLTKATRDFAGQKQQSFSAGEDEKLAQELNKLTVEYKQAYKELQRLKKQMEATPAKELAEEISRVQEALEGLESASQASKKSAEDISGLKAKNLEEEAISALIDKYRSIEPIFKKAERAVVQYGNAQRKAIETAKTGTVEAQASAKTNEEIARRSLESILVEVDALKNKPEFLEAVLSFNEKITAQQQIQNELTEKHRRNVDTAYIDKLGAKYGEVTGMTVDPKQFKAPTEALIEYSNQLGKVVGKVEAMKVADKAKSEIEAKYAVQIKTKAGTYQQLIYTIDRVTGAIRLQNSETSKSSTFFERMGGQIKSAAQKITAFTLAGALTFGTMQKLREGWSFVSDLDKDLTQVAIVQGTSRAQTAKLAKEYSNLGQEMGKTVKEISSVNTELIRQGLTMAESKSRMETILKLSSVGMITSAESLKIITSAVNALGVGHQRAADVLVKASQISASSVEQLGEAFTKAASSARAMGMTIEQTTALLATMVEKTQEGPSELGTSLKTIMARFSKVNEETGEFNEELNDVQSAIESVGIQFLNSAGEIRSMYDVLQELGGQWDSLNKNTKAYLATQIAGVRQQNRFFAVMSDFNRVLEIQNQLVNAKGTLDTGYEVYLSGIEAQANATKSALEGLYTSFISSELIKTASELVQMILRAAEAMGALGTGLSILAMITITKNLPSMRLMGAQLFHAAKNLIVLGRGAEATAVSFATLGKGTLLFAKSLAAIAVSVLTFVAAIAVLTLLGNAIAKAAKARQEQFEQQQKIDEYTAKTIANFDLEIKKVNELEESYKNLDREIRRVGSISAMSPEDIQKYGEIVDKIKADLEGLGGQEVYGELMQFATGLDGREYIEFIGENIKSLEDVYRAIEVKLGENFREGVKARLVLESGLKEEDSFKDVRYSKKVDQMTIAELKRKTARELAGIQSLLKEKGLEINDDFLKMLDEETMKSFLKHLQQTGKYSENMVMGMAESFAKAAKDPELKNYKDQIEGFEKAFKKGEIGTEGFNQSLNKVRTDIAKTLNELELLDNGNDNDEIKAKIILLETLSSTLAQMGKEPPPEAPVDFVKSYEDAGKAVDSYSSNMSLLSSANDKIKKGLKLNREEIYKLTSTFPELAQGFALSGEAIFNNGEAIKAVAQTARKALLDSLYTALKVFSGVREVAKGVFIPTPGPAQGLEEKYYAIAAAIKSINSEPDPFASFAGKDEKGFSATINVLERGLAETERLVKRTRALIENEFAAENKLPLLDSVVNSLKQQQKDMSAAIKVYDAELQALVKKINNPKLAQELTQGTFSKLNWSTTNEKLNDAAQLAMEMYDSRESLKDALVGVSKDLEGTELNRFTLQLEVAAKRIESFTSKAEELSHARQMLKDGEEGKEVELILAQQNNAREKQAEIQKQIFELQSKSFPMGSELAAKQAEEIKRLTSEYRSLSLEVKGYGDEMQSIYDEMYQTVKNLIMKEEENRLKLAKEGLDLHKKQLDILNKTIEARRKAADNARKELEFARQIGQIEMRKAALQRAADSGDRRAAAKLVELLDQETKIKEDQARHIADREDERIKEKYQTEYDEQEEVYKKMEKTVKDFLENAQRMHIATVDRINGEILTRNGTLFRQLEENNIQYGTGIAGITDKWKTMLEVVKKIVVETNKIIAPSASGGQTLLQMGLLEGEELKTAIMMKQNGDEWHLASASRKKELEAINRVHGARMGWNYDSSGIWKKDGVRVFDNGGYKPKGVMGVMGENTSEWFFKDKQLHEVQKMAISEFLKQAGGSFQGAAVKDVTININGNVDSNNIEEIKRTLKETLNEINKGQLRAWQSRGVTKLI